MNHSSLERVQQDLDVVKSALPTDFPYDRGNVADLAAAGLCGVVLALRAIPGWDRAMLIVLLVVILGMLAAFVSRIRRIQAERGNRPRRWAWARDEWLASGIAILAGLAYILLIRTVSATRNEWDFAAWRSQIATPVLFAFGIGLTTFGVLHRERRSWLGLGLILTAVGLATPWIPTRTSSLIIFGTGLAMGSLISAAILWWQLRTWEAEHVQR